MHRKLLALTGVAACALAAPAIAQTPAPLPVAALVKQVDIPYQEFTLANGLRVIVHTDRKAPIVAVSTWYNVGSKEEAQGKTGFAHLFEHLMFNGSENAPGDFFVPLRSVGATDFNGTTSFDRTNYFETVPRPALDRALFLESDRMGYLLGAITQDVLDEQRGVVQNEKRQNDNQPYGLVYYKILEGLLPAGHPYGHTPIGSMADLDKASLEDVKTWFRSHYGPNNAVLVLAGDIDVAAARPLVEKYFGKIPRGPQGVLPKVEIPTLAAPKSDTIKDRVAATLVTRVWAVPGLNDKDATALAVAGEVLGGLSSSRLDNALVRQEKLAVQVSAGVQSMAQIGFFTVRAVVRPGADAAQVSRRLDEIIADFLKNGPTADEVQRVATTQAAGTIRGLESVGGFGGKAVALAEGAVYSNDPTKYKKDLEELAAIKPEQVKAAADRWLLRPAYSVMVVPGARDAYVDAVAAPAKAPGATAPTPAAAQGPARNARGGLPDVGQVGDLDFPKVTRARLANGIEVVYAQRTAVPITQMVLSFDAGQAADPAAKLGTQTLTLAAIDEGTTTLNSVQLAEAKERLGAQIGTGSSADRTTLSLSTPSPNLPGALALFADVVENPAFAPDEVARVKNQVLAGIAQEMTTPARLAARELPKHLYAPGSPYAKLAAGAGDPAAVQSLTRDDLVAFQHAWLRPDKARIFVVSDRPLAEIRTALDARFGAWQPVGPAGAKTFAPMPMTASPKIVLIDRPDSPQSIIVAGIATPLNSKDELLPAITGNKVLGQDFLSRINMDLREARHWSYGSSGSFSRLEHAVPWVINAPVQADKTGEAIKSLQADVKDFVTTKGVTPEEFERTITGDVRQLSGNYETAGAVLGAMQLNDMLGRPDDYYATITAKYRALTLPQLDTAIRAAIDPARLTWVVVGDAAKVRPQLDGLGLPVEVVQAGMGIGAPPATRPTATDGAK